MFRLCFPFTPFLPCLRVWWASPSIPAGDNVFQEDRGRGRWWHTPPSTETPPAVGSGRPPRAKRERTRQGFPLAGRTAVPSPLPQQRDRFPSVAGSPGASVSRWGMHLPQLNVTGPHGEEPPKITATSIAGGEGEPPNSATSPGTFLTVFVSGLLNSSSSRGS